MQSTHANEEAPTWASSPGRTIRRALGERATTEGLSKLLGCTPEVASQLLSGDPVAVKNHATQLAATVGGTRSFWAKRATEYTSQLESPSYKERLARWHASFPAASISKLGWSGPNDVTTPEGALQYFGAENLDICHAKLSKLTDTATLRTSNRLTSKALGLAAWLFEGTRRAEAIPTSPWSERRFIDAIGQIRTLTRTRTPATFLPKLTNICASAGVAFVLLRAIPECKASGATLRISDSKRLLLLSARFLADDQFWFSFFHEAAHLILHQNESTIDHAKAELTEAEREANELAASMMMTKETREQLQHIELNKHAIRNLALQSGLSPGIIVGQLQHLDRLHHATKLNRLKARFTWGEEELQRTYPR